MPPTQSVGRSYPAYKHSGARLPKSHQRSWWRPPNGGVQPRRGCASKPKVAVLGYLGTADRVASQPQRGCASKPKVAVLGYLGTADRVASQPQRGCASKPKVAVLGYLGTADRVASQPQRGCGPSA